MLKTCLINPVEVVEPDSYFIEYWFNKSLGLWFVVVHGLKENKPLWDIESDYTTKSGLKATLDYFKEKYNTVSVRKV